MNEQGSLLVSSGVAFALAGVFLGFASITGVALDAARILPGLLMALVILGWCRNDAAQHGRQLSTPMRILIILLGPIAFIAYAFRSNPWRAALLRILKGLAAFVVYAFLLILAAGITQAFVS